MDIVVHSIGVDNFSRVVGDTDMESKQRAAAGDSRADPKAPLC